MLPFNFDKIGRLVLLSSCLLVGCDSAVLCGQYACVWFQDDCETNGSCTTPRQCEAAGSIRDRAPRIINQLREAQRSCATGTGSGLALVDTNASELVWDETLARVSSSHANDMANHRFESFIGTDGLSTTERVTAAGIDSQTVFESIISGPQTVAEAINSWLDIGTDCQQLVAADVTRVGMACATRESDDNGPYWSLLLVGPEP